MQKATSDELVNFFYWQHNPLWCQEYAYPMTAIYCFHTKYFLVFYHILVIRQLLCEKINSVIERTVDKSAITSDKIEVKRNKI